MAANEIEDMEGLEDKERGKRILVLFQQDLMPGINGQILVNKTRRSSEISKGVCVLGFVGKESGF